MKKYLMLVASSHNWGIIYPGKWKSTTWRIFSDGSYEIITDYVPKREMRNHFTTTGIMNPYAFSALCNACRGSWGNPFKHPKCVDGTGWQIRMYAACGIMIKTSGRMDYIYGKKKIEQIIDNLP